MGLGRLCCRRARQCCRDQVCKSLRLGVFGGVYTSVRACVREHVCVRAQVPAQDIKLEQSRMLVGAPTHPIPKPSKPC